MSSPSGVVPGLFDRCSVNLLIGGSGSGKTHLLFSQLSLYAEGKGFLRYGVDPETTPDSPSFVPLRPVQLGLLGCIHDYDHFFYTAAKFPGLANPRVFPIRMTTSKDETELDIDNLERAYLQLSDAAGQPIKFLIVEGFQYLLSSGKLSDSKLVRDFCLNVAGFCQEKDLAILGTAGSAKMKRGESYPLLGDRIFGGAAWSQGARTLLGIEQIDLHRPAEERRSVRKIAIQVRGGTQRHLYADFDEDGRLSLVPTPTEALAGSQAYLDLDRKLEAENSGTKFTREQLFSWGEEISVTDRTVERWIASRVEVGFLVRVGATRPATYQKPHAQ
jgi:hypothetical protein